MKSHLGHVYFTGSSGHATLKQSLVDVMWIISTYEKSALVSVSDTLRPAPNYSHFADDIIMWILRINLEMSYFDSYFNPSGSLEENASLI